MSQDASIKKLLSLTNFSRQNPDEHTWSAQARCSVVRVHAWS